MPDPIPGPEPLSDAFRIRPATLADIDVIAHHRSGMFSDMGSAGPELLDELEALTRACLLDAIPRGEYIGWLACPASKPDSVVAGAGVQLRRVLPFPKRAADGLGSIAHGRQGIVLNVYTERAYRGQGLARRLMQEILAWARVQGLDSLVLHAAPAGRALYESLGFSATNEMRFVEGRGT